MYVNGMVVLAFLVALVFVGMGVSDQRRLYQLTSARRRYWSGRDYEPSDAALVFQRVTLFAVAVAMTGLGAYLWHTNNTIDDENAWSNAELRAAVAKAATNLGPTVVVGGEDTTEDHSMDIEDRVGSAAGDQAPGYGVHVEKSAEGGDDYEITAEGADAVFCMSVYKTKASDGPNFVPGSDSSRVKEYGLKGRVRSGSC